jgi:hypothetical protein
MKTDAFRAQHWIDDKDCFPLRDGIVGALGFTGAAIDTIVGNHRCHRLNPPKPWWNWNRMKNKTILDEIPGACKSALGWNVTDTKDASGYSLDTTRVRCINP